MVTEFEKIQRAKMYIDKLAKGINPLTDEEIPEDTILNNARLSRCFSFISDVLRQVIDNGGLIEPVHNKIERTFAISGKQKQAIILSNSEIYFGDLTNNINSVIDKEVCRKFKRSWVTSWLTRNGFMIEYLDEKDSKRRKVTPEGESIGLRTEMRSNTNGDIYPVTLLNRKAQAYIIENIEAIVVEESNHEKNRLKEAENQGSQWSKEDERMLIELYKKKVPVAEIVAALKRTEEGTRARLKKLGVINRRSEAK